MSADIWNGFRSHARVLVSSSPRAVPRPLPVQIGPLRVTGATLEGERATDRFEIVSGGGGDVAIVLFDLSTPYIEPDFVDQALVAKATLGLQSGTPLHAIMLDLVDTLFAFPGTELRALIMRCSAHRARVEIVTAGMPPPACVHPGDHIRLHSASAPPLVSTTSTPPAVEVSPLIYGSAWLLASDGCTSGSNQPEFVRRLAQDLELEQCGLALTERAPDSLRGLLASRLSESGRSGPDDATLVLVGADPNVSASGR